MKVACHFDPASRRSVHLAHSMAAGIRACGDEAVLISNLAPEVQGDICVAYGWAAPELFRAYRNAGKPYVYLDLGWWNRKPEGALLDGSHKVSVNCREPRDVFSYIRGFPPRSRFDATGIDIQPWRDDGSHIVIAGMSAKSANTYALDPEEWERKTIQALRHLSWSLGKRDPRGVIYRPKPSWRGWTQLPGAELSPPEQPLRDVLAKCWALVTHHSNVAVDALLAGVPVCVEHGVTTPLSTPLARLWKPIRGAMDGIRVVDRRDLLCAIAWLQWTTTEMRSGQCWQFLKDHTELCD